MHDEKLFAVYILTNVSRSVLYIGMTNNLQRRMIEHREGRCDGFAKKYHCTALVYFETAENPEATIAREKELKGWSRMKKNALISISNPRWADLFETIW